MKIQLFLLISLLFVPINALIEREESVIVTANDGKLRGSVKKSRNSRDYFAFQGVKYARIGERFQPAIEVEPWTGIKEAIEVGSECPQIGVMPPKIAPNSEDCLFLNVYTPDLTPTRKNLPVMVWIHGGAFCFGSGTEYGPDYFMDEDVILVTINYRLSSLGFLNTGDGVISGNAGLRDMVMALKWVQRNIQDFNGDPKRVTIFGESAGGISVSTLMISPAAKGLFHRAIAQSGTSLNALSFMPNPSKYSKLFAEKLGCPTSCSKKMVECLQNKDLSELLEVEMSLIFNIPGVPEMFFGVSVDSIPPEGDNSAERILPASPYELIRNGAASDIPLIIGMTETEFAHFKFIVLSNPSFMKQLNSNWVNMLPEILDYKLWVPKNKLEEIGNELRKIYFNSNDVSVENIDNYGRMTDQVMMMRSIILAAELHAQKNPQVFPYVFTQRGKFSMVNAMGQESGAPIHADEIQYLFKNYLSSNPQLTWPELKNASDIEFSKKMVKLWTSFADSGKPSSILGLDWKPVGVNTPLGTDLPWYTIDANPKYFKFSEEYKDKLTKMDALLSKYENPPVSWRTVEKSNHQEL